MEMLEFMTQKAYIAFCISLNLVKKGKLLSKIFSDDLQIRT